MESASERVNFSSNSGNQSLNDDKPGVGRIMALDVGKKRIGLALSDPLGITAQGIETLQRTRIREDLDYLTQLATDQGVNEFLIGLPLHMSGDESRQAAYTREFGDRLGEKTGLPVVYWDERWTSVIAGRVLRESGIGIEKRAKAVDKLSAVLLLESYLDSRGASFAYDDDGTGGAYEGDV
jgi:putative holliday junction resolvase